MGGRLGPEAGVWGMGDTFVRPGAIIADKYRIERVLGRGGMGVVLEATHVKLGVRVAIKLILPEMLESEALLERFAREARAAARIQSDHVVRVTDVGTLESGAPYMVMEYLEGQDLCERVKKEGPLAPEKAVDFVLEACEALGAAHEIGIVHRDLKTANLFCAVKPNGQETIKLLDFGISKAAGEPDLGMTSTKMVLGSPHYMSPEQMLSAKGVDARTDIWAMGVVLYELLAGTVPFTAETFARLVLVVSGSDEPDWNRLRHVDPRLIEIIRRCLQRIPDARFKSVADLSRALRPFASATTSSISIPAAAVSAPNLRAPQGPEAHHPGDRGSTLVPLGQTRRSHPSRRRSWIAPAAILGALAIGALLLLSRPKPLSSAASDASALAPTQVEAPLPAPVLEEPSHQAPTPPPLEAARVSDGAPPSEAPPPSSIVPSPASGEPLTAAQAAPPATTVTVAKKTTASKAPAAPRPPSPETTAPASTTATPVAPSPKDPSPAPPSSGSTEPSPARPKNTLGGRL
jgi:serine/threonine protein kinase